MPDMKEEHPINIRQKETDEKFCSECGATIKVKAEICPKCGVRQVSDTSMSNKKDKTTAGIFALFLGGLGIHKFYLNKSAQGILYILFCWTFIPSIIAFIEGIIYLTMDTQTFNQKYNK